jgi:raffinose/stachyose/melibiose transport system substrate-binding protein
MHRFAIAIATAIMLVAGALPATAQDAEGVTLTAWVPPVLTDAQKKMIADYEAASGNTVVQEVFPVPFEQGLLTKWATGERPDILFFHAIGNWLVQLDPPRNLQDLSNEPFVERTIPGILDKSATYDGKIYGAVINYPFLNGVFYNKPLFEELGLTIPTNYEELKATCTEIKEKAPDVAPIYTGGGDQWPLQVPTFMMWNSDLKDSDIIERVNRNEATLADPVFVSGIEKLKELHDLGCLNEDILTATYEGEQQALMDGSAAMVFQGSWIVGNLQDSFGLEALNETVGFFGLSSEDDVVSWQTVGSGAVFLPITGDEARETAARGFVDWVTGEGYAQYLADSKQFPIIEGHEPPADVPAVLVEANDAFLENGVPQWQQTLQAAYGPFETFLQEMIAGQITPQDVGDELAREFAASAKELGLPGFE